MPKIGIEDRVFSWVMHLSDLNNIISHVSICPKYPRVCSFLFDIIARSITSMETEIFTCKYVKVG